MFFLSSLNTMCWGVYFLCLSYFEFCWTSWKWRLLVLLSYQIWEAVGHYFWNIFATRFSSPMTHMLVNLVLFHRSLKLCSFFFDLFSFCSSDCVFHWAIINCTKCFLVPAQICCWTLLVNYCFIYCNFSTPEFPFGVLFYSLYLFIEIPYLLSVAYFNSLYMVSFNSLNVCIHIVATLKY